MKGENINVIDNIVKAISILNTTDTYLEGLNDSLSKCDSEISDYEHFIENSNIADIDTVQLFKKMQEVFLKRRTVKKDMALRDNYYNLSSRLNNSTNREFLIQNLKNTSNKLDTKYKNRILTEEELNLLTAICKKPAKRGRPRKVVD